MGHFSKGFRGLLIAALMALVPVAASAATFTVNATNHVDDSMCDASHCSLREAINAANAAAGADEIVFHADLNGQTIELTGNLPDITDDLTITGPGSSLLTVDGNDDNRMFVVDGGGITVSISGLYLFEGYEEEGPMLWVGGDDTVTVTGVTFASGYAAAGGAVYNYGDLTLINSHFVNNEVFDGYGGALYNDGGILTINGGSFRNSYVNCGDGGAIYNDGGDVTITGTLFDGNELEDECTDGGAIYTAGGTLTITDAVFNDNAADDGGEGGAIYIYDTTVEITDSTFTNNYADNRGGAIRQEGGELTIIGSTLAYNYVDDYDDGEGGAIAVEYGDLIVMDSSITNNYAEYAGGGIFSHSDVTIINTIVDNNTAFDCCSGGGIEVYMYATGGALAIEGGSVSGNMTYYGSGGGIRFYGNSGHMLDITGTQISNNESLESSGGGIYASGTGYTLLLSQSTVSGNYSYGNGGGLYINYPGEATIERSSIVNNFAEGYDGGGVYFSYGALEIVNSTLSGNTTDYDGGGVYADDGTLDILHSTITNNAADVDAGDGGDGGGLSIGEASVTLTSSIVSGNFDFSPGGGSPDIDGDLSSGGTNLIGSEDGVGGLDASDIVGMDPLLGPLVSLPGIRGSSVHPLLMGSPARAAAAAGTCPDTDQLGLIRAPLACDIGAMRYITLPGVDGGIVLIPDTGGCVLNPRAGGTFGSEGLLLLLAIGGAFYFERRRRARAQS